MPSNKSLDNKLHVEAICHGTVIDHIPANIGFRLLHLFKLTETHERVTVGLNLPSREMGRKDLIKIENTFLTDEQANQLAMYAPKATINQIQDYEVIKKFVVSLPANIEDVLVCPNSNCISHNEPVVSNFAVLNRSVGLHFRCHYCEKEFAQKAIMDV
ncbi:aspartate carbamoyltransferase regulatory subunit [Thorsellia anophelis]|uniref:Aspartate carbamoyltransferase regulatory chain n=1 Tax=Thorsellia anophelis DSM 18579 TaxID=1123402 RepID=A0A1I0EBJ7_9GAMM|nr:aspartate carbamoyltransferase regulatory subunit [Thorsellia anophelis]SET42105.1 aspartate carbamoyltransferase regulatory subunit [Thorsellia anophelis DSM 18579]